MTSNLPIEPQDAAQDQSSAAMNVANVRVSSPGPVRVLVQQDTPAGHWFQILEELILDGTWGALQDRHRNVLVVMHYLRNRDTSEAYAPLSNSFDLDGRARPGLLALTRLPRATLYDAIREMCVDPAAVPTGAPAFAVAAAGLLAKRGRDLFLVMPGRVFAGRRPPIQAPASVRCTGISPVHRTGVSSPVQPTGRLSGAPDWNSLSHMETQARSKKRIENSSTTTNLADPDWAESLRLLTGGIPPRNGEPQRHHGFGKRDAERLLERTGASLADVRTAVANAGHVARSREGLRSWNGYVRRQLEDGCSLFPALQREQDNARRVSDRLHRLAEELGDEATCGALTAWWARQSPSRVAGLVGEPAWNGSDEAFWAAVTRKVSIEISG